MKSYESNTSAQYGLYVSTRPIDARFVGADGERLEGIAGATYRRLPTWALLLCAPLLGGAFVMAFPVLAIFMTAAGLARVVASRFHAFAGRQAWLASPRWEPGAAYLSKTRKVSRPEGREMGLDDLRALVDSKRAEERENDEG